MRLAFLILGSVAATALSLAGCSGREQAAPATAALDSGVVVLADASLPYVIEGTGRPCLVIGSRIYYPKTFSSRFKSQFRCVYLDQRHFVAGAAARTDGVLGIEGVVADIEAARQQLGLDQFVLIGHSIHGLMVMAYARRYPEHVSQVIALGAAPEWTSAFTGSVGPYWDSQASTGRKAAHAQNWASVNRDSLAALPPGEAFIATYVADAARYWADSAYDASWLWAGVEVNMARVNELFDLAHAFSFAADTGRVNVPVFVALGRLDFAVPYISWETVHGPFSDLTVHIFDHAGHTPQLEDSTAFDDQVLAWLGR